MKCSHLTADTNELLFFFLGSWLKIGWHCPCHRLTAKISRVLTPILIIHMEHFLFPKCLIWTDCSEVLSCKTICFHIF